MKAKMMISAAALFFYFTAQSQNEKRIINPETIVGKVFYDFHYLANTAQPDHFSTEVLELDFGKNASLFKSYTKELKDAAMQKIEAVQKNSGAIDEKTIDQAGVYASPDEFYTQTGKPSVTQLQFIGNAIYLIKDTVGNIQWKILDSTKTIQGNLCQKAVGESHGRTYTAWFCSDLPYSFGPRRLHGLPGLTLEAHDNKREIAYTFNHLEKNGGEEKTGLPEDGITATYAQYNKMHKVFESNPAAFLNKQGSNKIRFVNGYSKDPAVNARVARLKQTVNPIDLK